MKQVEFENQMREMKQQKSNALRPLQDMLHDVKEQQAAKKRSMHELGESLKKLEQQRIVLASRHYDIAMDWNKRISDFQRDNYTESRELENVSDWALVKELNKRGFYGGLLNNNRTDDAIDTFNAQLNIGHTPEDMLKAISDRLGDIKVTKEKMEGHLGKAIEKRASEIIRFTDRPLPKSGIIIDGVLYEGTEQNCYDRDKMEICQDCVLKETCDNCSSEFCSMHSLDNYVQYKKVEK